MSTDDAGLIQLTLLQPIPLIMIPPVPLRPMDNVLDANDANASSFDDGTAGTVDQYARDTLALKD